MKLKQRLLGGARKVPLFFLAVSASSAAVELPDPVKQELERSGWSVESMRDGSLTLKPSVAAERIEAQGGEESAASSSESDSPGINRPSLGEDLKRQLESSGWRATEEADGTLVVTPPIPASQTVERGTEPPAEKAAPVARAGSISEALESELRSKGWQMRESEDGSLIFTAPGDGEAGPQPAPSSCAAWKPDLPLDLPIDDWGQVREIAGQWVDRHGDDGLSVGKIRKVLRIYLVSIVEMAPPHLLRHQLIVRRDDGQVIKAY